MNKRIKELAFQSLFITKRVSDGSYSYDPKLMAKLEKFAELIVRECFDIVDEFGVEQAGIPSDVVGMNLLVSMKITEAAWKVKEHFGVE